MAIDQEVLSHPRDVHNVLGSLPTQSPDTDTTRNLLDAIAREDDDLLAKMESPVFRGILTAMMWLGGLAIASALVLTFLAILR